MAVIKPCPMQHIVEPLSGRNNNKQKAPSFFMVSIEPIPTAPIGDYIRQNSLIIINKVKYDLSK